MSFFSFSLTLVILCFIGFSLGKGRVIVLSKADTERMHSLPSFHGWCTVLWCAIPAFITYLSWLVINGSVPTTASVGIIILSLIVSGWLCMRFLKPSFRARPHVEMWGKALLFFCAALSIVITIAIVGSILFEALRFFDRVSVFDFIFGTVWSPQTAMRAEQAGSSGSFGAVPVFLGTFMVTLVAILVAVPLGIYSSIYISEYASKKFRAYAKPALEILAGVPTVVYGYFAAITVAPLLRDFGTSIGLDISSESALSAGFVMGIMIIPFILSLSDDVINAVPQRLRDGALALGATRSETMRTVILPAALPGIIGAVLLAISRAIGETMIVVMAAGLAANLTLNPLESVTTVTVQIVTLLVGDQEFDSAKTLAAFALGLTLFVITLLLNMYAIKIVKKYREAYD